MGLSMDAATRAAEPQAGPPSSNFERALKFAVIGMGVLIVLGVLTVIGRIVYLASRGPAASGTSAIATTPRLALPAGAVIRNVSLSGDRMAVHFDATTGSGIAILDLATGRVLSRVELIPEPPRTP
jgi:hypothetical protein